MILSVLALAWILGPVLAVAWVVGTGDPRPRMPASMGKAALRQLRVARGRAFFGLGMGLAWFAFLLVVSPLTAGISMAVSLTLSTGVGMIAFAFAPGWPGRADEVQTASLQRRRWTDHVSPGGVTAYGVVTLGSIAALIVLGLRMTGDQQAQFRDFARVGPLYVPSPGWVYAFPMLLTTVFLLVATGVALWRVSSFPSLPGKSLQSADRKWREASGAMVLQSSAGALLMQTGAVISLVSDSGRPPWEALAGPAEVLVASLGWAAAVAGVICLGTAAQSAWTLPARAMRAAR